jgi:hypothetical protein
MGDKPRIRNDERHRPSIRKPGCDAEPSRDVVVQRLTREADRLRAENAALRNVVAVSMRVLAPYSAPTNNKAEPSSSLNTKGYNGLRVDRGVWRAKK